MQDLKIEDLHGVQCIKRLVYMHIVIYIVTVAIWECFVAYQALIKKMILPG